MPLLVTVFLDGFHLLFCSPVACLRRAQLLQSVPLVFLFIQRSLPHSGQASQTRAALPERPTCLLVAMSPGLGLSPLGHTVDGVVLSILFQLAHWL